MFEIKRSEDDISEQRALARGQASSGSTGRPDRSFEDGVACALDWLFGDTEDPPFGLKDVES